MLYLGTLVQDGLAHMRGVTWQAVPAKFKTGMCEMNKFGSEVCSVFWDVGSGWVGSHVWCNMESCSGLGPEILWCIFGTLVQDGSGWAHIGGVICSELFRQSSKQGCVR